MKKQQGFTLIELIMVIVILGILAAFALPRFANLGSDAREASFQGAVGAARSAIAITRSAALVAGVETTPSSDTPAPTVNLDGLEIAVNYGFPTLESLEAAAQFEGIDYSDTAGTITVGSCVATYTEATSATAAATLAITTAPTANGC